MPTLANKCCGSSGSIGNVNLNIRNLDVVDLDADNISCKTLTIDGEPFPDGYVFSDIQSDSINVNGLGTFNVNNRNYAAEVPGTTTHEIQPGKRPIYSGDGSSTNPQMSRATIHGRTMHHGLVTIERYPEGGPYDYLGPCLQIINEFANPYLDGFGFLKPALTSFQFGHDFHNPTGTPGDNKGCAWLGFMFYGDGDSRNCFVIDSNANFGTTNPAFVIQMTTAGIPANVGIHTQVPEAPLDITGNTIIRDQITKRKLFESRSEGTTESVIYFRDTTRSTNYANVIIDCYNGDFKIVNPETDKTFAYFDTTTETCQFFKNISGTESRFMLIDCNAGRMQLVNAAAPSIDFVTFDGTNQRTCIGAQSAQFSSSPSYGTILTGNIGVLRGGLSLESEASVPSYVNLRIGLQGSLRLFRTDVQANKVMIGTSTADTNSILTVEGDTTIRGNLTSNNFVQGKKGLTTMSGVTTIGTEPSLINYMQFVWTANTINQTVDGRTLNWTAKGSTQQAGGGYSYCFAFSSAASKEWRSNALFNSSGTYTGSASLVIDGSTQLGEYVEAVAAVGGVNQMFRASSITYTLNSVAGVQAKDYIIYGTRGTDTFALYKETNTVFTANQTKTVTASTTGAISSNWNKSYDTYGIMIQSVGGATATTSVSISQYFVTGNIATPVSEVYAPNCLEVGTDLSNPQVLPSSVFRVNGDSILNGSTTIRQPITVDFSGIIPTSSQIGYTVRNTLPVVSIPGTGVATTISTHSFQPGIWMINLNVDIKSAVSATVSTVLIEFYDSSASSPLLSSLDEWTSTTVSSNKTKTFSLSGVISVMTARNILVRATMVHTAGTTDIASQTSSSMRRTRLT